MFVKYLWNGLNHFGLIIIRLIVGIYFMNMFDPVSYARLSILQVVLGLIASFGTFGLGTSLIHHFDLKRDELAPVFSFSIITGLFFSFLLYVLSYPISHYYDDLNLQTILLYLLPIVLVKFLAIVPSSISIIKQEFKLIALSNISATFISIILSLVISNYFHSDILALMVFTFFTEFISGLFLLMYYKKYLGLIFSLIVLKKHLIFGWPILKTRVLSYISKSYDVYVVSSFFSPGDLAFYSRAINFANIMTTKPATIISEVLFSELSSKKKQRDNQLALFELREKISDYLIWMLMLLSWLVVPAIVFFVLKDEWVDILIYFRLYSILAVVNSFTMLLISYLKSVGDVNYFFQLRRLTLVLSIFLGTLGAFHSMEGLIVMLIVSNSIIYFIAIKKVKGGFDRQGLWNVIFTFVATLLVLWFNTFLQNHLNPFTLFSVTGSIFVFYALFMMPKEIKGYLLNVITKLK